MRVAVLDDIHRIAEASPALDRLREVADLTVFTEPPESEAESADRLTGFQIVIPLRERTRFTRSLLQSLPDLELIAQTGTGVAHIDLQAATEHGVLVTNTLGASEASVAELTFGLIFALLRAIPRGDREIREGQWVSRVGRELRGRILGIVGLGGIGAQVARIATAFSVQVLAWGPTLTVDRAHRLGAQYVPLEELLRRSDVVTLHLRLSEWTRGILGRRELSLMKPSAILVNTARAALVNEAALIETLQQRRIAGAGLDVFWEEPLPADHPLVHLENVVVTPHIGWITAETYEAFFRGAVENVLNYLAGRPSNVVNPDALQQRPGAR